MQETIGQMSNQVTEKWNALNKKQKLQIGIGVLALIVMISSAVFLTRTQMRVLYSESKETKFVAETTKVLADNGITYKVINDGTNIEVDEKQYNSAVMALSLEGVTDVGYTFEDVMNNSMSTTDDEKKQKMNYFTKEELQRTFKEIDGVEEARVILNIPEEKNSFLQAQQESSASVLLTLSKPITAKQAEGMANYMSYAVKNLEKKNVTIMDTSGSTLFNGSEDQSMALSNQQELKQSAENQVKTKVLELLSGVYDDIRISPNLILDFNQHQETSQEFTTQGEDEQRGVIQNEVSSSSSSTNSSTGGEPGSATNGGNTTNYQMSDGTTGESKSSDKQITYLPNKKETVSIKNIGDIDLTQSSIAVNVFKNKVYREEEIKPTLNGTTWAEFKVQNGEQRLLTVDESIIKLVQDGTGIQTVSINAYEKPIFLDEEVYQIAWKDYLPFALIILIFIVAIIAVMKFRKPEETVEVEPELEVEEMLKTAKEQVEIEEIELKETLETKRQIDKFVDEKPEAVANLLRNWLSEEDWE